MGKFDEMVGKIPHELLVKCDISGATKKSSFTFLLPIKNIELLTVYDWPVDCYDTNKIWTVNTGNWINRYDEIKSEKQRI